MTKAKNEMNSTINRYHSDGTENLDYWFGPKETKETSFEITITPKPRYVRYSLKSLNKRSTKRLAQMYANTFGKVGVDRQVMITDLYRKLNQLWNSYEGSKEFTFKTSIIGVNYIEGFNFNRRPKGRKPKFEEMEVFHIIFDNEAGMKLTDLAKKYKTNIATISNILNCKGTYAYLFVDNEIN